MNNLSLIINNLTFSNFKGWTPVLEKTEHLNFASKNMLLVTTPTTGAQPHALQSSYASVRLPRCTRN